MSCHGDLPNVLPQFKGIEKNKEDWSDWTPEWYALIEKECGAIPGAVREGARSFIYYVDRFKEYSGNEIFPWE